MTATVIVQVALLAYHQITTWVDLHPFNGVRNYTSKERWIEAGVNALLMGLPIVGFGFHVRSLMRFGVVYYPVLFAMELIIWWIPYVMEPRGRVRSAYNLLLSIATSNFGTSDALTDWLATYRRIHSGTVIILPKREGRIVPNLEHTILHIWTAITAIVTIVTFVKTA